MNDAAILTLLILAAAALYASVGQAGASGYLAAMAIMGVSSDVMKPAALVLNVVVATIATVRFYHAGAISWSLLWPLVVGSVPLAFIGGAIHLPSRVYNPAVGVILLATALRMTYIAYARATPALRTAPPWMAVMAGAVIGLVSGLTGTGGGIFVAPLIAAMGWAGPRETAGASAAFVLVNSLAGLAGNVASVQYLPSEIKIWAVAAAIGGLVGAELGSRRIAPHTLSYLLAAVLIVAALKMILS